MVTSKQTNVSMETTT